MKFIKIGISIFAGLSLIIYSIFFSELGISSNPRDWESTFAFFCGVLAIIISMFSFLETKRKNQIDLIKHNLQEIEKIKKSIPDMEIPIKGKQLNDFITPFEQAHSDIKDFIRISGEKYNLKSKLNCNEFDNSLKVVKGNWVIYEEKHHTIFIYDVPSGENEMKVAENNINENIKYLRSLCDKIRNVINEKLSKM